MTTMASPSSSFCRVTLTTAAFETALQRHLDEHKPDPIAKKQLEGWNLEWTQGDDDETCMAALESKLQNATHALAGRLCIRTEFMRVVFWMECIWNCRNAEDPKHGTLYYECRVDTAEVLAAPQKRGRCGDDKDDHDKDDKTRKRIRAKMTARLRQDSYIAKHLLRSKTDSLSDDAFILAKARIQNLKEDTNENNIVRSTDDIIASLLQHQQSKEESGPFSSLGPLEERVDVSEPIAEAVRRAIWSSAESSLDVAELVLALPSLPTVDTVATTKSTTKATTTTTTPLANRAKLRLLEDAMLDACEREGEDELLEDLTISKKGSATGDGAGSSGGKGEPPSKRGKTSKSGR